MFVYYKNYTASFFLLQLLDVQKRKGTRGGRGQGNRGERGRSRGGGGQRNFGKRGRGRGGRGRGNWKGKNITFYTINNIR